MKTIGFVAPWYDENIPGGAEMALRGVTTHLHESGVSVEILTTCVKEFSADWNKNFYPDGTEIIHGFPVRRFKVRKRDTAAFDQVNAKLIGHGKEVPVEEEKIFMQEMVNSPDLYTYMRDHTDDYSLYVFIPYMFGTTFYGVQVCPEKSVMIPCFHNESYSHMKILKPVFEKIGGMIYHAAPEMQLANELFSLDNVKQTVLGTGVYTDLTCDAQAFRDKFGITEPFIIYAGRKDHGKNVHILIKYFAEFKKRIGTDLKLVLIGGGSMEVPESVKDDVIDLGFVSIQDKYNAQAAALLLCQPSPNESFSLVIMESWLCHRPVIVYEPCDVTKNFAIESNGGLYFNDYFDFEGCVNYMLTHPQEADAMGENGRQYVLDNFAWDVIVEKYTDFFQKVAGETI